MTAIVTCGPSFEPVDEVRRLTNFSTGELGTLLSRSLFRAGHETLCFRGVAATHGGSLEGINVRPFTTNEDLARQLLELSLTCQPSAIFHAAALSDFRVARVVNKLGQELHSKKISSRESRLTLELEPSFKLIHHLRSWFPQSKIVGWKYELEGTTQDALSRVQSQIVENHTNACIINGHGYGEGFGFYEPNHPLQHFPTKPELCEFLTKWIK